MSDDLHFADPQLLSVSHVEIGAATRAQGERIVDVGLFAARPAAGMAGELDDVEARAGELRALGTEVEAEADGVGHDTREPADLEHHARHAPAADTFGDGGHDALRDRELMHAGESTFGDPAPDRTDVADVDQYPHHAGPPRDRGGSAPGRQSRAAATTA